MPYYRALLLTLLLPCSTQVGKALDVPPPRVAELPPPRVLVGNAGSVAALGFSQDGHVLASGSREGLVKIWNVRSNKLLQSLTVQTSKVCAVAFSPTNDLIVVGGENPNTTVWDITRGKLLRSLDGQTNGVSALAFTSDGLTLATGGVDGTVFLWDTRHWVVRARLPKHPSRVHALRFSSNDQFLAGGSDAFLRISNLADPAYSSDTLDAQARAIGFHDFKLDAPRNKLPSFISSDGGTAWRWRPSGVIASQSNSAKTTLRVLGPWTRLVGFNLSQLLTNSAVVAVENTLTASGGTLGKLEILNTDAWEIARATAHSGRVECLAFSPGASVLASSGEDKVIKLWDTKALAEKVYVPK